MKNKGDEMGFRRAKSYCDCQIVINPRYTTNNQMIKMMAAQECYKMWGGQ